MPCDMRHGNFHYFTLGLFLVDIEKLLRSLNLKKEYGPKWSKFSAFAIQENFHAKNLREQEYRQNQDPALKIPKP